MDRTGRSYSPGRERRTTLNWPTQSVHVAAGGGRRAAASRPGAGRVNRTVHSRGPRCLCLGPVVNRRRRRRTVPERGAALALLVGLIVQRHLPGRIPRSSRTNGLPLPDAR